MILLVQAVNFALSFLMWMIIGRAALRLVTGGKPNALEPLFERITQPVFALTRRTLPFVGERGAPTVSFLILALLRVALILAVRPAAGR